MNWPWVSRRAHDIAGANFREVYQRWIDAESRNQKAEGRCADLERALDIANALKREEQWRRIKAEGEVAFRNERIKRVLGLPIWPADEEKKAG